jgi:GxxExxY protein
MNIRTALVDTANAIMNEIGPGHTKEVYQKAFYISLKHKDIMCEKKEVAILFEHELVGILSNTVVSDSIVLLIDVGDTLNVNEYITTCNTYMRHSRLSYGMVCIFPSSQNNRLILQHI